MPMDPNLAALPEGYVPPSFEHELDILDEENPYSLVNMCPPTMANPLRNMDIRMLTMKETELRRLGNIGETENLLRHSFWGEYNYAVMGKRKVIMPHIYNGICKKEQWWNQIVTDSYKLAFILTPPVKYRIQMSEMLDVALKQMRDILNRSHVSVNKNGQEVVNTPLANVKIRITETLLDRVHGAAIQKIQTESKSLNVSVNATQETSLEDIEKQIKQAEAQLKLGTKQKALKHDRKEKDVTASAEIEVPEVRLEEVESASEPNDQGEDNPDIVL